MPYIVLGISPNGYVVWLSAPCYRGIRAVTTRETAQVFPTVKEAEAAITELPQAIADAGLSFVVEEAD
jgi:hypothetical protein